MSNNYESIIGKDQNVTNDNLGKSEKYNRIIEIPVQHISSGGESTSNFDREKSPLYNSKSQSPSKSKMLSNSLRRGCTGNVGRRFGI